MVSSSSQRIGIVTSRPEKLADYFPTAAEPDFIPTEPPFTPDDQLLIDELRRRGHQVSAIVWGADTSRLAGRFDRIIIRSPWDYMDSDELRRGFLRWLEALAATGVPVENDLQVMLWLMDKRYLLDFAAVGVPIVPTQLIPAGGSFDLETFVERHVAAVIKPPSPGPVRGWNSCRIARQRGHFSKSSPGAASAGLNWCSPFSPKFRRMANGRSCISAATTVMAFTSSLPAARSWCMPNAAVRSASPIRPRWCVKMGDRAAAAVPRAFANRGDRSCRMPLYLRINIIETASGGLLSECEGVEPELFFRARPGSAARFAELVENRAI